MLVPRQNDYAHRHCLPIEHVRFDALMMWGEHGAEGERERERDSETLFSSGLRAFRGCSGIG